MQQFKLYALNSASFVWTLDFNQVAALYGNMASFNVRMQIKSRTTDAGPIAEFGAGSGPFTTTVDPVGNTVRFSTTQQNVAALLGPYVFDIRVEISGVGEFVVAYGAIEFFNGVTQANVATNSIIGAGLGDTVFVILSQPISPPAIQPFSIATLNDLVNQAAASANSAATSLAATIAAGNTALANVAAAGAGYSNAVLLAWLAGLPLTKPATAGLWWIDGDGTGPGVLSKT